MIITIDANWKGSIVSLPPARLLLENANRRDLAAVRDFVKTAAAAAGLPSEAIDDLIQAADEAATNVIVHGYGDRPGRLEVAFQCAGNGACGWKVRLVVRDQAPPVDPRQAPPPDLSKPLHQRKPGGMGIHLIRQCIDTIDYQVLEDGNELVLTRYIARP